MTAHLVPAGSIIVAVDGSEHAARATRWAVTQASLEQRRLVVVAAGGGDAGSLADKAAALAAECAPDVAVTTIVDAGDPRGVLVELSRNAHLLVVGSRGRGVVRSMLLGSVSSTVSKLAWCPVVVCRPSSDEPHRGVLVGADGTPESRTVIDFAFRHASLHQLPLTVVHCAWDAVAFVAELQNDPDHAGVTAHSQDLHLLLAESVAGFSETYPDVVVTRRVANGLVDQVLVADAAAWDLIVVGRHPVDSLGRILTGSIATAVIERASTTVAVVPQ